jgi:hypothetical protein
MMRLDQAIELARRFHHGATDKAGRPYISHVQRVVDRVTNSDQKLAAALHDLLEDTPLTSTDLLAAGCSPRVIAAVEALTRRPGEEYEAFLRRAASDPIARTVKLADIADNADETRLAVLEPAEAARLRSKYERARSILARQEEPSADSVRRLQEAEYAEIGIPSGEAAAWTTFWCADCGRPAGTFALIGHDIVLATFLGRMTLPVADNDLDDVCGLLEDRDVEALNARDSEWTPFWCPVCKLSFCGTHWAQETLFDDGFFDEIRGTCPRGHTQQLWD